jgi:hypothetical protein
VTFIRATSKAKPTAAAYHAGPTDAIIPIRRAYPAPASKLYVFVMVEPGFTPDHIDAVLLSLRVAGLGNARQLPE